MYLLMTEAGQKTKIRHDKLAAKREKRKPITASDAAGCVAAYISYLVILGALEHVIQLAFNTGTVVAVGFVIIALIPAAIFVVYWTYRLYEFCSYWFARRAYSQRRASGEIVDIADSLVETWRQRQHAAGLNSFNEQTQMEQYPEVIAALIERHDARSHPLATDQEKELLSAQIEQIIDEVLVPLATQVKTASTYDRAAQEAKLASDRELLAMRIQNLLMGP